MEERPVKKTLRRKGTSQVVSLSKEETTQILLQKTGPVGHSKKVAICKPRRERGLRGN